MLYLSLADLLRIAEAACESSIQVRDAGLLDAAAARPAATIYGTEVYPDIHSKAAALAQSIACNHALVDGNKRLALASIIVFYSINGYKLTLSNTEAYELIIDIATGKLREINEIAMILHSGSQKAS